MIESLFDTNREDEGIIGKWKQSQTMNPYQILSKSRNEMLEEFAAGRNQENGGETIVTITVKQ